MLAIAHHIMFTLPASRGFARRSVVHSARHRRSRVGFSLTELLVVIGIIVLLMGILLVALRQVQIKARRTETEARMQQFMNACIAFQAEHGVYPGVIPDKVLVDDLADTGVPKISSTENALLHLMGGYRARGPQDVPGSPAALDYDAYKTQAAAQSADIEITFGVAPDPIWNIIINTRKLGEGPVINGKPYPAYFTPGPSDIAKAQGQLSDAAGNRLPDVIDAWGQPVLLIKQTRDRGPLVNDATLPTATRPFPQFEMGGVTDYLNSTSLGELSRNQVYNEGNNPGGCMLGAGVTAGWIDTNDDLNKAFATVLAHPAFYKSNAPLYGTAKGSLLLMSAGPDGIFLSAFDGPGSKSNPITGGNLDSLVITPGPRSIEEFDDIRVFGGG